jgi:hypothetical protein
VKFNRKETDRNRQEQTGTDRIRQDQTETDRNSRNRHDYLYDIENYCIIKKFISEIGKREVVARHFVRDAKMTDNRLNIRHRKLLHHKEIHISCRNFKRKKNLVTDRIRQDQTGN